MQTFEKSTGELFTELKDEKNLSSWCEINREEFVKPLNEYLLDLLEKKSLKRANVIRNSGLNREYGYRIFNGTGKNPSRPKILALALAMELDLEEVQYLLRYAGMGVLYPRNSWDAVIISALEQKLSVMQTNELLDRLGEKSLLE